jgi:pseudouridylate synthase
MLRASRRAGSRLAAAAAAAAAPHRRHVGDHAPARFGGLLRVHDEVAAALAEGRPVVALESTIISHGMPFPANLECALGVEAAVRAHGAVPATVAVMDGAVRVGLAGDRIEALARAGPAAVRKVSRRDLASAVARRQLGATTVAGTMAAAHSAGIAVFATGGIGGVHRGGEATMDVSADLTELGRTPVAVVCAGVKSILDIPRTLEYLETQGVPVVTLGQDGFPAFYTPDSGVRSPERADSPDAVAAILHAGLTLGLANGMVVAVPNPAPAEAAAVGAAIETALREADAAGIAGWRLTPFLLERVATLTHGDSLRSNVTLVTHNAGVGAQVAVALAARQRAAGGGHNHHHPQHAHAHNHVGATGGAAPALAASGPAAGEPRQARAAGAAAPAHGSGQQVRRGQQQLHTTTTAAAAAAAGGGARRHVLRREFSTSATAAGGGGGNDGNGDVDLDDLTPEQQQLLLAAMEEAQAAAAAEAARLHPGLTRVALPGRGPRQPVVVGGAVVDLLCRPAPGTPLRLHTSNPGTVRQSFGGVGRNVAEVAARLVGSSGSGTLSGALPPVLFTAIGPEPHGAALAAHNTAVGVATVNVAGDRGSGGSGSAPGVRTSVYAATLDERGDLLAAVADMSGFDAITPAALGLGDGSSSAAAAGGSPSLLALLAPPPGGADPGAVPPLLVVDGNVPAATTAALAEAAAAATAAGAPVVWDVPVLYEPTSVAKCVRGLDSLHLLTAVKPNRHEVLAMAAEWRRRLGLVATDEDGNVVEDGDSSAAADKKTAGGKSKQQQPARAGGKKGGRRPSSADGGGGGETAVSRALTISREGEEEDQAAAASGDGRLLETRTAPAPGGGNVTLRAYELDASAAAAAGSDDAQGEEEGADDPDGALDYAVLTATQAVLAGMVRPSGLAAPLTAEGLATAERTVRQSQRRGGKGGDEEDEDDDGDAAAAAGGAAAAEGGDEPSFGGALSKLQALGRTTTPGHTTEGDEGTGGGGKAARRRPAVLPPPQQLQPPLTTAVGPGATLDGRKHVLVSLGATGVLWLSAPPAPDDATADLLAALPFFAACQHPRLALDFKLCPAPEVGAGGVVKVTGAGDTLTGTLAWALACGASLPRAIELGLGAARIAVTSDVTDGASTLSPRLTAPAVASEAAAHVRAVDDDYA